MAEDTTTAGDTTTAAEKARAEAEARRQRILEKSKERMGVVSGETGDQEAGASRLQAMRRRRFKKNAPKATEDTKKEEEAEKDEADKEPEEAEPSAAAPMEEVAETKVEAEETKKKYKGVARMRREKLKMEKKGSETEVQVEVDVTTVPVLAEKPPVPRLPILVNLVAVLLLFLAGLDIGWNQVVFSDVMIHRELTPRTQGFGILNRNKKASSSILQDPAQVLDTDWSEKTEEEFASSEEAEEEYVPNIDPLFQVDLDALTKGDGLFLMLARGAVSVHRVILRIFYYLPISILQTLMAIPQQLIATPPVLCIVSLVVRQVAKLVFGGKLPDPASDPKDSKDVLGMMRQGVINFLTNLFPTAVSLYDIWTHLRSDMYVILCGVFVGLAYTHSIEVVETYGSADEL